MKIKVGRILAIGVPLGILCVVVKNYLNISSHTFWIYYCIFAIAVILLTVLIAGTYHYRFGKKLNQLTKILLEEKDIDRFIDGNKRLLNKTKGKYHKALIHINLSAGYCEKGDFTIAKEVLLKVPEKALRGLNQTIYYINLSYIHFWLKETETALLILGKFDKEFSRLENHRSVGGQIAILRIFNLIYTDKLAEAQSLRLSSKEKWTDERLAKDWEYLKEIITEKESEK